MGWASAGVTVFDPVAAAVVKEVEDKTMGPNAATRVLSTLISLLQDDDWDTEQESLARFADRGYVVRAFMNCNVVDEAC